MAEDGGGGPEEVERLRQENAELTQQSEQLQALLKDVSADLGEEVHSMSMSMSAAGGAGMLREIEALEEVEQLRSEKAAMEVVMKQMAIELDDERRKDRAPQPARTGSSGSPSSPSAAAREAEVVLLRRQLQEERLARRAAARAAQQTEERLQLRVEELEAMLGEAICDVIDASQINQTAWGDEDAPCPDGAHHRHQTAPVDLSPDELSSCPDERSAWFVPRRLAWVRPLRHRRLAPLACGAGGGWLNRGRQLCRYRRRYADLRPALRPQALRGLYRAHSSRPAPV